MAAPGPPSPQGAPGPQRTKLPPSCWKALKGTGTVRLRQRRPCWNHPEPRPPGEEGAGREGFKWSSPLAGATHTPQAGGFMRRKTGRLVCGPLQRHTPGAEQVLDKFC